MDVLGGRIALVLVGGRPERGLDGVQFQGVGEVENVIDLR